MKFIGLRAAAVLLALILFGASPARAEWRRAESPNFILYGSMSELALRERITRLEDFDRLLREMMDVTAPPAANKLHIYIVGSVYDFQMFGAFGTNVGGFYSATPSGIAAFVDGRAAFDDNEVLFHEYAHHFMLQYAYNSYPAWYIEGFAEYFMTVRFNADTVEIGMPARVRGELTATGSWLPWERVLSGEKDRNDLSMFYAQSWLLTHYFYSDPEKAAALGRLLTALRSAPPRDALQSAMGMTPEALATALRRYFTGGHMSYRRIPRAAHAPPPVAVTVLTGAAGDMVLLEAALRVGVSGVYRERLLERIRSAAARHRDDPVALRLLAHAEILYGDGEAGDRLLDGLLATTPDDAGLMFLKGMRRLNLAQSDHPPAGAAHEARTWFGRAHRADPNNYQTLFRYVQSFRGDPGAISDNIRNVIMLAHDLAPQVSTVTSLAAYILMRRGEFDDAVALLSPLARDPHGSSAMARRLLAQAQAHTPPDDAEGIEDPTADPHP